MAIKIIKESVDNFFNDVRQVVDKIDRLEVPMDEEVIEGAVEGLLEIKSAVDDQLKGLRDIISSEGEESRDLLNRLDSLLK